MRTNQVHFEDFLAYARKAVKKRASDKTGFFSTVSKLERAFRNILASKLPTSVKGGNFVASVQRLFRRSFDVNHSGQINLDELEVSLSASFDVVFIRHEYSYVIVVSPDRNRSIISIGAKHAAKTLVEINPLIVCRSQ